MSELLKKPELLIGTIAILIALFTAVAAWFSARAAARAARETGRATQAQLLNAFLDAYASPEMLDSMTYLRQWVSERGSGFADDFRRLRKSDYDAVQQVDHARRRVSHYFQKVYSLYTSRFLDEAAARTVATRGQVEFFREVIEPLEAALNVDYDRSSFDGLGTFYGIARSLPMAGP